MQSMTPQAAAQEQLDAYNARDLERFIKVYSDDIKVYAPPAAEPTLQGKAAFAAHYANNRFNLPALHAEVLNRIVVGNKVIDHERVTGVRDEPFEVAVVYEVVDGVIRTVWFYAAG
ncbi:MAG TPA: nuclear transport factor 2 family protein [Paucimonas sp.]|nr:nuclear transport factor 2 family protein [Paucimonas sp.]